MKSIFTLKFEKKTNPSKEVLIPIDRDQFNHLFTWKEHHDERTLDRMFADIIFRYEEKQGLKIKLIDDYKYVGIFVGSVKQD
tara:strand:+ start:179 stop:424 length:246 start_codon:yes stop_codon:yes gene_type:complete